MNVGDLDLNLLRAFDAVLRDGSVTSAAKRLGLSQPAMSNALARLRRLLGDPLFMRTPGGMRPTPFAQQLAAPVQQALDLIRASLSQQAGFDPKTSDRIFRFQPTDVGRIAFLPPLLQRLQRDAPLVRVETQQLPQDEVSDALASGEVDVAVGFLPELSHGVVHEHLFRDRYVCLVRSDHPRIGSRLTRAQFLSATHVLVSSRGSAHEIVEQTLRNQGLVRKIALRVPHFTVVPMILARTDHMVIVPEGLVRAIMPFGRFKALKPPVDIPALDVRVHWHERFDQDPGIAWLRRVLVELYAQ